MAGIDSSIYGMMQQPKPLPGPLEQYGQGLQVGNMLDQRDLHGLQRQHLQQQIDAEPATRQFQNAERMGKLLKQDDDLVKSFAAQGTQELMAVTPQTWGQWRAMQTDRVKMLATPQYQQAASQAMAQIPEQYDPNWVKSHLAKSTAAPAGHTRLPGGSLSPIDPEFLKGKTAVAEAGRPVTNVNVSTEKKYGEAFAGQMATADANMLEASRKAPDLATRANQVLEMIGTGKVITGAGADVRLQLGKALNLAGASDAEVIANTEILATDLARNTLDAIKASGLGAGSGFSNADRDFLEKAVGGKITLEGKTIERLAELAHKAAEKTAARWGERVKQIPANALSGAGIPRETPTVPARFKPSAATQQPTQSQIDAELRRRGVIK